METTSPPAPLGLLLLLLFFLLVLSPASADYGEPASIIFKTLGRDSYNFDIYTLPVSPILHSTSELRLTDGLSVNFNGHFPSFAPATAPAPALGLGVGLVYVTERNGTHSVFYDTVSLGEGGSRARSALEVATRVLVPGNEADGVISMKDRPSLVGDNRLVYVSTHEDPGLPRASWAAVYLTELTTGSTRRLTPPGVADFSPAVSPSGRLTAVASYAHRGWDGEVEDLSTDIYVFLTLDGSNRVKVVEQGGWPSWVDDSTFFFHRRSEDGWISVYKATLPVDGPVSTNSVSVQRVTPGGLHAFTPAASPGNDRFIALATRRPGSDYRHIELFDLVTSEFSELTQLVSPETHHFNPFMSPDSSRVGYHRCRGGDKGSSSSSHMLFETVESPVPGMSLFRIDGSFPSFSPGGDRIASADMPGVYVVNIDGSNRRQVYGGMAFSTVWDPVRKGVVYTSTGPTFASESTVVDVIAINVDGEEVGTVRKLTTNGRNNAFPCVSPDGKWIVFRSGQSGHKNLYMMDIEEGESGGLQKVTDGPWSDTMCNWSPDGEWITFSSDRESPGSGSFELYLIHPNGTGLRKLFKSGTGGRANHPSFSPDGKSIVFTSDYAGISAEPISNPHHYQPYGEIFTINVDGSNLKRLTHNSYEDGTPAWSPKYMKPVDVEFPNYGQRCSFEDCHWLSEMPPSIIAGGADASSVYGKKCQYKLEADWSQN